MVFAFHDDLPPIDGWVSNRPFHTRRIHRCQPNELGSEASGLGRDYGCDTSVVALEPFPFWSTHAELLDNGFPSAMATPVGERQSACLAGDYQPRKSRAQDCQTEAHRITLKATFAAGGNGHETGVCSAPVHVRCIWNRFGPPRKAGRGFTGLSC